MLAPVIVLSDEASKPPKYENPSLFAILPFQIIRQNLWAPQDVPKFDCPNRKALHEKCSDAGTFDKLTVPPVNNTLHHRETPLTKDSFQALSDDIDLAKVKPTSAQGYVEKYKQQALSQTRIADSFSKAGEHEGATMHRWLSGGFKVKAAMAEHAIRQTERYEKDGGFDITNY